VAGAGVVVEIARETLRAPEWVLRLADPGDPLAPFLEEAPRVVIVDGSRAGRMALEWVRDVREQLEGETPIVVVLGADAPEVVTAAYAAGASDVLVAPIEAEQFRDRVRFQLRSAYIVRSVQSQVEELLNAQRLGGTGSWILETKSDLMHWTPEAERMLGVPVGSGPRDLDAFLECVPGSEREDLRGALEECVESVRPLSVRHRLVTSSGDERWLEQSVEPVLADGTAVGLRGTLHDITSERRDESVEVADRRIDALTGVSTRPAFYDVLRAALAGARAESMAVLHIDVDSFGSVKHSMGHAFGDRLLQHLCGVLCRFAPAEHVCRVMGDEFAVLVRGIEGREEAVAFARRLQDAIGTPAEIDGRNVGFTVGIGVAVHPEDGSTPEVLLQNADLATHHAKRRGRNSIETFRGAFRKSVMRRFTLEGELRHALARGELFVEYQPRVLADTRIPVGVEALARWEHAALGRVSPQEFIPIAEQTGLIGPIGNFVLETACREMAELRLRGLPMRVSVNVSSWQFAHSNVWEMITGILRATELPPDLLEIEITESLMVDEASDPDTAVRDLQAIGVRVALDDFGTGYSSLSYVSRFPLDVLKLDRSIIRDVDSDPHSEHVAAAVVRLAHSLEMEIVGEGVDNEPQAEALHRIGCDELQGFLFSHSLRLDDLEQWLRAARRGS